MVQPSSLFGRARDDLDDAPVLGLGHRRDLGNPDHVALVARIVGVVCMQLGRATDVLAVQRVLDLALNRSEEHTSELQSLMRISYAVFCLKKKKYNTKRPHINETSCT